MHPHQDANQRHELLKLITKPLPPNHQAVTTPLTPTKPKHDKLPATTVTPLTDP